MYLYWALVGLILDIQNQPDGFHKNTQIELSKRILSKIDVPLPDSRLAQEFKQLCIIIYDMSCDNTNLLRALSIRTKFSPSEDSILRIKTLIDSNLKNEAIDLCKLYAYSSSTLDFSFWTYVLNLASTMDDGLNFANEILAIFKEKEDVRAINLASIELKLVFVDSYPANICQMIYDYAIKFRNKPSMINDVILILKRLDFSDVESVFTKISNELVLVLHIYFIA